MNERRPDGVEPVSFVPSRVEGVSNVTSVVVHPERLELHRGDERLAFDFQAFGRRRQSRLAEWIARLLGRAPSPLVVAERDWFHQPRDRFFRWYTNPPVTTYMPLDERLEYGAGHFQRIQEVLGAGGFTTFDLG